MLRVEMLPARHGDALWIEYGDPKKPRRVLIDGGPPDNLETVKARIAAVGPKCRLELFVVTHVDDDHIGAALDLVKDPPTGLTIAEVWFNDWRHMPKPTMNALQGRALATQLKSYAEVWNAAFEDKAVVDDEEDPPVISLAGGATITLLSPDVPRLKKMAKQWQKEIADFKAKRAGGGTLAARKPFPTEVDMDAFLALPFKADTSAANGSSIAFLFEYAGKKVLFGADAYADVLLGAIQRLSPDVPLALDAFKLPHHGSMANVHAALLEAVDCKRFLVSTNGDIFRHPDPAAIARVIDAKPGATLFFNYRSTFTSLWDDAALRKKYRYKTVYRDDDAPALVLDL